MEKIVITKKENEILRRHQQIIKLISEYNIATKTEIHKQLKRKGYNVSSATITRDAKKLKLEVDVDGYLYVLDSIKEKYSLNELNNVIKDFSISLIEKPFFITLQTKKGYERLTGEAMDELFEGIIGYTHGDRITTLFFKDEESKSSFKEKVNKRP